MYFLSAIFGKKSQIANAWRGTENISASSDLNIRFVIMSLGNNHFILLEERGGGESGIYVVVGKVTFAKKE